MLSMADKNKPPTSPPSGTARLNRYIERFLILRSIIFHPKRFIIYNVFWSTNNNLGNLG